MDFNDNSSIANNLISCIFVLYNSIIMLRITLTFCLLSIVLNVWAQDFEVAPVVINFNANPGEIQTRQINLINHSTKPQKYTLKLADYEIDKEGNKRAIPLGTSKRSCADWITLNPSFIELNPNQSTTINAMITVPKDGFVSKWCIIYVEASLEQSSFEVDKNLTTGVVLVPRIVIQVNQSPKSVSNYKATISGLKESTKPGDKMRSFEALVTNTGDNVIEANVSLAIADIQTAKEEKFNPVQVTVYPDAARIVKLQLSKELKKGKYAIAAILDYGHRKPLEGTQLMLEVK
jgi:hypothetical protein